MNNAIELFDKNGNFVCVAEAIDHKYEVCPDCVKDVYSNEFIDHLPPIVLNVDRMMVNVFTNEEAIAKALKAGMIFKDK